MSFILQPSPSARLFYSFSHNSANGPHLDFCVPNLVIYVSNCFQTSDVSIQPGWVRHRTSAHFCPTWPMVCQTREIFDFSNLVKTPLTRRCHRLEKSGLAKIVTTAKGGCVGTFQLLPLPCLVATVAACRGVLWSETVEVKMKRVKRLPLAFVHLQKAAS